MSIKILSFVFLPLLSSGHEIQAFMQMIKNTGSSTFFSKFFEEADKVETGKCAFVDMDFTFISACFEVAVLAAQIEMGKYSFTNDDIPVVLGLKAAHLDCQNVVYKDSDERQQEVVGKNKLGVSLQEVVAKITAVFDDKLEIQKDALKPLIAMWNYVVYQGTQKKPNCDYLRTTVSRRLLYKMDETTRSEIINKAFKLHPTRREDRYYYKAGDGKIYPVVIENQAPVYPEMLELFKALKKSTFSLHLISASDITFVKAMATSKDLESMGIEAHGSKPNNDSEEQMVFGNGFTNDYDNKVKTMDEIITKKNCKFLFAAGDSMGDHRMLEKVLSEEPKGYALFINGPTTKLRTKNDLEDLAKRFDLRAHIQDVDEKNTEWKKIMPIKNATSI